MGRILANGAFGFVFAGMTLRMGSRAADFDSSKLPPASEVKIDFARDIKPILDKSCIRCHGPEKPKSGFRLDNKAAALKGGDDGVDIVPGESAKSALIRFVSGLDPDTTMPPEGKGDPLTKEQVGLLRAWIDQGVAWDQSAPTNFYDLTVTAMIGATFVGGDERKFREHSWQPDGVNGGAQSFDFFERVDPNTSMEATGHATRDDYKLTLELKRSELGFVRAGWQQFRHYYDDTGGIYPPLGTLPLSLDQDLWIDNGKAWIDFGLTLPHWPRMVLGYEYDYRQGTEATTAWGSNQVGADPRNIAPNTRHLDEGTHVIKFDFNADIKGLTIDDRFRGEFYTLNSSYTNLASRASIGQDVNDRTTYFQGANSLRLERKVTDWLLASGGYFYSKLDSDDSFTDVTTANNGVFVATVPQIHLSRATHMFNVNGLVGPFAGLTLTLDVQSEWTRQEGFGVGNLNGIAYTRPPGSNLTINPATLSANYDENTVWEGAGLHFSKIPFTALFAEARFRQVEYGQTDKDLQPVTSFLEDTSYSSDVSDLRAGFNTSPWSPVSLSGHYRRFEDDARFKTNIVARPLGGYPGFISGRDQVTDEFETKIAARPWRWLKATVTYQNLTTSYKSTTRTAYDVLPPLTYSPGGELLAGKFDSQIVSLGAIFTPWTRWSLSTTFSYQNDKTRTESAELVQPYKGDIYSVLVGSTYIFNPKTDVSLNYSVSIGDYSQGYSADNPNTPPPLGIRYQQHALQAILSRRINKNLSTRLQYGFYHYNEPSLASVNDYAAHAVFASLTYHFRK